MRYDAIVLQCTTEKGRERWYRTYRIGGNLPHLHLQRLPGKHGLAKTELDRLEVCGIVAAIGSEEGASGEPERAETMEDGLLEACGVPELE